MKAIFQSARAVLFLLLVLSLGSASLAGCSAIQATPAPLPTVVLDAGGEETGAPGPGVTGSPSAGSVVASGVVAPAQQAELAFAISGQVDLVNVAVGDQAQAGQALVQLEGQEALQAAISAAQFELEQAEQALKDLQTQAETGRVQAMQDIVTYARAVKDAQYALDNFTIPTNQTGMDAVTALTEMKAALDQARAAFEPYKHRPSGDSLREDFKEALDQAQSDYNSAVRRLQLEYDLAVAEAKLAKAQKDYEILAAGPDPDLVRLAEGRRANAQTQLAAAQAALNRLTLSAPFAGVVSALEVHPGEWVMVGQPVLGLADLAALRVETTDLSERDIPQVEVGQAVTVSIEALAIEIGGRVIAIAPLADMLGGDVVYMTTIELDSIPPGLRAGMSAEVYFMPLD
jgi:HlyD family secretion protein